MEKTSELHTKAFGGAEWSTVGGDEPPRPPKGKVSGVHPSLLRRPLAPERSFPSDVAAEVPTWLSALASALTRSCLAAASASKKDTTVGTASALNVTTSVRVTTAASAEGTAASVVPSTASVEDCTALSTGIIILIFLK
ncbi:hypothetical protein PC114_g6916 [Phytophthora cactorum]|uniref:Uncharacterized protein n=1 Tax=Phytophthora cactorum TaxID=29920 RepID=A0A8T1B7J6_9STRA|nr:hypothetical protein PC117_g22917 [Phytophthora cactorum]KAG2918050.1 hypothetical protein PC114_g6916 [Phytophthora cactorum]